MIERPDTHEVDDELYCWMPNNDTRECGPGCVAYDTAYKADQNLSPCKALNTLNVVPKILGMLLKRSMDKDVQQARQNLTEAIQNLPQPPQVR